MFTPFQKRNDFLPWAVQEVGEVLTASDVSRFGGACWSDATNGDWIYVANTGYMWKRTGNTWTQYTNVGSGYAAEFVGTDTIALYEGSTVKTFTVSGTTWTADLSATNIWSTITDFYRVCDFTSECPVTQSRIAVAEGVDSADWIFVSNPTVECIASGGFPNLCKDGAIAVYKDSGSGFVFHQFLNFATYVNGSEQEIGSFVHYDDTNSNLVVGQVSVGGAIVNYSYSGGSWDNSGASVTGVGTNYGSSVYWQSYLKDDVLAYYNGSSWTTKTWSGTAWVNGGYDPITGNTHNVGDDGFSARDGYPNPSIHNRLVLVDNSNSNTHEHYINEFDPSLDATNTYCIAGVGTYPDSFYIVTVLFNDSYTRSYVAYPLNEDDM